MSNRIIEEQEVTDVLGSNEILVNVEDEVEEEEVETESEVEAKTDEEETSSLPDKFKGKTVADIVKSYENLEKEYGRRNNEVGELRKLTDQLLNLQPSPKEIEEEAPSIDADSLWENPQEAINKSIENNPTLKKIQETMEATNRATELAKFEDSHPDWKETMGSEEFLSWVGKSKVRAKMLLEADQNYDYEAGGELLQEFKDLHPVKSDDDAVNDNEDKEEALKDITTEKKSKSKGSSKKIYSRRQLIEMKVNNPSGYAAREEEFIKAYEEGRVR